MKNQQPIGFAGNHVRHQRYGQSIDQTQLLREAMEMDDPAARLTNRGAQALTLVELVSFVLGGRNEMLTAGYLLTQVRSLAAIKARTVKELTALGHGVTQLRAQRVLAALELAERLHTPRDSPPTITSPEDAFELLADMALLEQEQLRVILMDSTHHVIEIATVYVGSVNTTMIRVAELMRSAVRVNAAAILIAHNHPSGSDPTPSAEDVSLTREVVQAAKLLNIDLLDHLVIGSGNKFVSLKSHGLGF